MERTEMINSFYDGYYEDTRLERSRHGQLEYRTTMHLYSLIANYYNFSKIF